MQKTMGIGRRAFLEFVTTAVGGLILDPIKTVSINGDYYVDTSLGLGFVKPNDWLFEKDQDFATKLQGQIVNGFELGTKEEEEFRRDQASTLVATISKYDHMASRFSPSITIFKNQDDYESLKPINLEGIVDHFVDGCTVLLRDYEVIELPCHHELSRCASVRFKSRWVFEHREIESVLINDQTIMIDQGSALYTIHLFDSPYTGEDTSNQFSRFLKNLHIA